MMKKNKNDLFDELYRYREHLENKFISFFYICMFFTIVMTLVTILILSVSAPIEVYAILIPMTLFVFGIFIYELLLQDKFLKRFDGFIDSFKEFKEDK